MVPGGYGEGGDVLSDELVTELLGARLIAKLATFNRDGSVHLVAMWFVWDGDALFIPTSRTTRKLRNLERDPRATVMVDDSRGGFDLRGVTLVGRVEIVAGDRARELNRRIHLKYVTIAFRPERTSSWNLRSTDQGRALSESGLFQPLD